MTTILQLLFCLEDNNKRRKITEKKNRKLSFATCEIDEFDKNAERVREKLEQEFHS
jgi:hypothetical protein